MKSPDAYRSISEVSQLLQIAPSVLRFWEKQFPVLKPMKLQGGRRCYRAEDIALIAKIQDLLYHQGLTIKGALKQLQGKQSRTEDTALAVGDEQQQKTAPTSLLNELQGLKEYLRNYV